jgi:DNA-directed DNA polymerase III PolC
MPGRFVPLHVHSYYSLAEGVDTVEDLLQRAAECGFPAVALTDSNNLLGAVAFTEAARRHAVRPLLGACLRSGQARITALVAEPAGYRSLCRVITRLTAAGTTPLAALLASNATGLHALIDDERLIPPLHEPFRGRLWLEVVRPGRSAARERALLEAGQRYGLQPVASLAPHFARPEGFDTFRLLAAVRQEKPLRRADPGPIAPAHHLADCGAVHERFRDLPEAVVNTARLADQCRSDVLPRGQVLPPARLPEGQDAPGYLRLLCERGMAHRPGADGRAPWPRLEQELTAIRQRDLEAYFLAVYEIAAEARRQGIPMALRGSAGNSLVCYLLGITEVDPLRFGLPFERFLHPGWPDLPDIDLDFDAKSRGRVLEAVVARYGTDHCARVGSLQRLQPRSAFRAAATAHGLSAAQAAPLLDELGGLLEGLAEESSTALRTTPRSFPLEPKEWAPLVADTRLLLGRPWELTSHPSGIVLTPEPADAYVPLQRRGRGLGTAHFDKDGVAAIGLAKIDLLSNRTLSALAETRELLAGAGAEPAEPLEDDTDAATLALLQRGDTLGVGQLETPAMRTLLRQIEPRSLADVVQAMALLRPGPMAGGAQETFLRRRRGLEAVRQEHPALEAVLRDSCGVLLFEDDCLLAVAALTGLPAAEADRLRRQVTEPDTAAAAAALLVAACQAKGIPRRVAERVCGQLSRFRGYSFCKSHAVSYGRLAWQAARLKTHFPVAFWTGVLNNSRGSYPRRVYVEAVKRTGIPVGLPCVNRSASGFSQEVSGLRIGLGAVRGLGEEAVTAVLEERGRLGPFLGFADFRRRLTLGPGDLALLVQVGAFDAFGRDRAALLREAGIEGQRGRGTTEEGNEAWPADWMAGYALAEQWRDEWELLGFLAGPSMMSLIRPSLPPGIADSRGLSSRVGQKACLAGLVAAARPAPTEAGKEQQGITLEDEWGLVEVVSRPGSRGPAVLGMGPWLVEGTVVDRHGVAVVAATRMERAVPGKPLRAADQPGEEELHLKVLCPF